MKRPIPVLAALTIGLVGCEEDPVFFPVGDTSALPDAGDDTSLDDVPDATTDGGADAETDSGDTRPRDVDEDGSPQDLPDLGPPDADEEVGPPDVDPPDVDPPDTDPPDTDPPDTDPPDTDPPDADPPDTDPPDADTDAIEPDVEPDVEPDAGDPLEAARDAIRTHGRTFCAVSAGGGCSPYDEETCNRYIEEYLPTWEEYGLDCLVAYAELLECFGAAECIDGTLTGADCAEEEEALDGFCF